MLTEQEARILKLLAEAWNSFLELPVQHVSDHLEMNAAIHAAQNIILARPTLRMIEELSKPKDIDAPSISNKTD